MAAIGELYLERIKQVGFIQEAIAKARNEGRNEVIEEILESGNVHSYQKDWLRSLKKEGA